jgi:hypothetical protein
MTIEYHDASNDREIENIFFDISEEPYVDDKRVRIIVFYTDGSSDILLAARVAVLHRDKQETIDKKHE